MKIKIKDNVFIGENSPVFIVAELSANHKHDKTLAIETIHAMKEAGADAVKLQTYTPDTMTIDCNNEYFQIKSGTIWDGITLYDLYKQAYTPWEWHEELKNEIEKLGMIFFSTPFDKTAVDFLEQLSVPIQKIASFEITDIPLIEYVASKGHPIIISTGIATYDDIKLAVDTCRNMGNNDIILLKCTSAYPAPIEEANLVMILELSKEFGVVVGLSDHTLGDTVAISSVALGAKLIEKHFILERKIGGPDAEFSMEPKEFEKMVRLIREVEKALGKVTYEISEKVEKSRVFARSLFVVEDIKAGEIITEKNVRSIRPGYGLHPKYFKDIIGKRMKTSKSKGDILNLEDILME